MPTFLHYDNLWILPLEHFYCVILALCFYYWNLDDQLPTWISYTQALIYLQSLCHNKFCLKPDSLSHSPLQSSSMIPQSPKNTIKLLSLEKDLVSFCISPRALAEINICCVVLSEEIIVIIWETPTSVKPRDTVLQWEQPQRCCNIRQRYNPQMSIIKNSSNPHHFVLATYF